MSRHACCDLSVLVVDGKKDWSAERKEFHTLKECGEETECLTSAAGICGNAIDEFGSRRVSLSSCGCGSHCFYRADAFVPVFDVCFAHFFVYADKLLQNTYGDH